MLDTDFKFGEVHNLALQVESVKDKVHFRRIFEDSNGGVSLIAFKIGQALAEHQAPTEVMVTVLEGDRIHDRRQTPYNAAGRIHPRGRGRNP